MKAALGLLLISFGMAQNLDHLIPPLFPLAPLPSIKEILGSTAPEREAVKIRQSTEPNQQKMEGQKAPQEQTNVNMKIGSIDQQLHQETMPVSQNNIVMPQPVISQKYQESGKSQVKQPKESVIFQAIPGVNTIIPGLVKQQSVVPDIPVAVEKQPFSLSDTILGGAFDLRKVGNTGGLSPNLAKLIPNNLLVPKTPNLRIEQPTSVISPPVTPNMPPQQTIETETKAKAQQTETIQYTMSSEATAPTLPPEPPAPFTPIPPTSSFPNCELDDGHECLRCNKNSQLISGNCLRMPDNCKSLNVLTNSCLYCDPGFSLVDGKCQ